MSETKESQQKKVLVTTSIKDLDGKEVANPDGKLVTFRSIVCNALVLGQLDKPMKSIGEDKIHQYSLAMKIREYDEVRLSEEDMTMIFDLVAKAYSPIVLGRVCEIMGKKIRG